MRECRLSTQGGLSDWRGILLGRMSALAQITDHVYWMPPGPPDRPSLCGVVGDRRTLMLDAGSSTAHTRAFLDALLVASGTRPSAVVYTHSDWDHVLGGVEVGGIRDRACADR